MSNKAVSLGFVFVLVAAIVVIGYEHVLTWEKMSLERFKTDERFADQKPIEFASGLWTFSFKGVQGVYRESDSSVIVPPDFELVLPSFADTLFYVVDNHKIGIYNINEQEVVLDPHSEYIAINHQYDSAGKTSKYEIISGGTAEDRPFLSHYPETCYSDRLFFQDAHTLVYHHTNVKYGWIKGDTIRNRVNSNYYSIRYHGELKDSVQNSGVISLADRKWKIAPRYAYIIPGKDTFLLWHANASANGFDFGMGRSKGIFPFVKKQNIWSASIATDQFKSFANAPARKPSPQRMFLKVNYRKTHLRTDYSVHEGDTIRFFRRKGIDSFRMYETSLQNVRLLDAVAEIYLKGKLVKKTRANNINHNNGIWFNEKDIVQNEDFVKLTLYLFDFNTGEDKTFTFYVQPVLDYESAFL